MPQNRHLDKLQCWRYCAMMKMRGGVGTLTPGYVPMQLNQGWYRWSSTLTHDLDRGVLQISVLAPRSVTQTHPAASKDASDTVCSYQGVGPGKGRDMNRRQITAWLSFVIAVYGAYRAFQRARNTK